MEASTMEARAMAAEFRAMERAELRNPSERAKAISADGIRTEYVATISADDVFKYDVTGTMIANATIESWELPNQIIRRPFKEYIRPRIRRNPISPVECEILRMEADAEKAIVRAMVKAEIAKRIAEKAEAEKANVEAKRAATNAAYKAREAERKRNARKAKRNAR